MKPSHQGPMRVKEGVGLTKHRPVNVLTAFCSPHHTTSHTDYPLLILSLKISLRVNNIKPFGQNKSNHGENSQGKNYPQGHAVSWQILQWDSRLNIIEKLDVKQINILKIFSICRCFWWRDLVSILLCICGLHHSLCIPFIKVTSYSDVLFV